MLSRTFRRLYGPTIAKRFYPCRDHYPEGYGETDQIKAEYPETLKIYHKFCKDHAIVPKNWSNQLVSPFLETKICEMRSHMATIIFLNKKIQGTNSKKIIKEIEKHRQHRLEDFMDRKNTLIAEVAKKQQIIKSLENIINSNQKPIKLLEDFISEDFDIDFWDRHSSTFLDDKH